MEGGEEPLAARMRPQTLDEFWGQRHILGKGRLLRRAIEADRLSSVIFYGPPGTGKTTLARIIANTTRSKFMSINAVLSGVKEIRDSIDQAKQNYALVGRKSILFVDEVHRFNKSQQDALLPWVENGTITLIGATTENPYFEVNKALVSRSRIFQLKPLTSEDLKGIAHQALRDVDRGYGRLCVNLRAEALEHLVNVANGDARALLNALELAVTTTPADSDGRIDITLEVAEESIQQRAVLYDKEGDAHFDTISAFIKSVRGSDPDAALYWLARMVAAGESANFIFRRLLISACEDIGLADPHAVSVVASCAEAFDRIGMPEGRYHLAHATIYLATAPKSNSSMGFFDALSVVEHEQSYDIPNPMKDASRDKADFGHGAGYLYPHAYRDHWVAQQYLPDGLQGRIFYHPTDRGYEATIAEEVTRKREAQLALYEEMQAPQSMGASQERWIGRTFDGGAARAEAIREFIFTHLPIAYNSRVLDIHASSGMMTFEALRRSKQGCVYSLVMPGKSEENFKGLNAQQPEMTRAVIKEIGALDASMMDAVDDMVFDCVMGRHFLHLIDDLGAFFIRLKAHMAEGGRFCFADQLPSMIPRISGLIEGCSGIGQEMMEAWRSAEAEVYKAEKGSDFGRQDVERALALAGLSGEIQTMTLSGKMTITPSVFEHWFSHSNGKPSYLDRLGLTLSRETVEAVRQWAYVHLRGQTVDWPVGYLMVSGGVEASNKTEQ